MSTLWEDIKNYWFMEGLADEAKDYRTKILKARIIKKLGEQVGFLHPKNRAK